MDKKTVAYITRHRVTNYGSALQTYATHAVLERLGYEAVCIDYIREAELSKNVASTRLSTSRWNANILTRIVYLLTQKPIMTTAAKRFDSYIGRLVKTTEKEYHSEQELKDDLPPADVYMTGSDQVWNIISGIGVDPAYFLSFVPDDKKKIAYAASFGGAEVNDKDRPLMTKLLSRYQAITVREKSGVKLVESMGAQARQVLDPTLLIEQKDWLRIIPDRPCTEQYVLVYHLHPNKEFEAYAKEFAKRRGMKLIRIHPFWHHTFKPGEFIHCPPLEDFLWYIKNAFCLLTDSFHGTAFALGLNTPFTDVLPDKYSERIESLLAVTGLQSRILKSYTDFDSPALPIDFDKVNERLASERKESLDCLKHMIED